MEIYRVKKAEQRRRYHIRKKLSGTADRPRLAVFRSNKHIYAQIIDDVAGATLISTGTRSKNIGDNIKNGGNIKAAELVGETIAKEAFGVGIQSVCFDRRGYKYHGRVKALAEAARKAGLVF